MGGRGVGEGWARVKVSERVADGWARGWAREGMGGGYRFMKLIK
jgi:hypothetical protein